MRQIVDALPHVPSNGIGLRSIGLEPVSMPASANAARIATIAACSSRAITPAASWMLSGFVDVEGPVMGVSKLLLGEWVSYGTRIRAAGAASGGARERSTGVAGPCGAIGPTNNTVFADQGSGSKSSVFARSVRPWTSMATPTRAVTIPPMRIIIW